MGLSIGKKAGAGRCGKRERVNYSEVYGLCNFETKTNE